MFDEDIMEAGASYKDYLEIKEGWSICTVRGRIPKDAPVCERNKDGLLKHSGQGWCLYYRINTTEHCDHVYKPGNSK